MSKSKELQKLISELENDNKEKHKILPTDIKSMDFILGGGIELGSKVQVVAESSCGKSTIALQISKNLCKKNYNVLYVDTENSITKVMLNAVGVAEYYNNESDSSGEFVLLKESDFNTVSDKLDICLKSKYFHLIIIDSLASLVSNCYTDIYSAKDVKSLTNNNTNFESRPLNLFINKYSNLANKYNVAILYINQFRNKVDPKNGTILKEYGNKIVKYNSDIIVRIKKDKDYIYQDDNDIYITDAKVVGGKPQTHAKIILSLEKSNKMLSETSTNTYLKYGYGIDEILDDTSDKVRNGTIKKNGKYYYLQDSNEKYDGFISLVNNITLTNKKTKLSNEDTVSLEDGLLNIDFITPNS